MKLIVAPTKFKFNNVREAIDATSKFEATSPIDYEYDIRCITLGWCVVCKRVWDNGELGYLTEINE